MNGKTRLFERRGLFFLLVFLFISGPILGIQSSPWEIQVRKKTLENGLDFIYQKDGSSPITVVQIIIQGGKNSEPPRKGGIAYLTTRLALEIPDHGKIREFMRQSSRLTMTCKDDYSLISLECLSENLEETLKAMSRIMLKPLFSSLRIDSIKQFMIHQGKREEDYSEIIGHLAGRRAFFGPEGYGGSIYGDKNTLASVKSRDISEFHKSRFTAENMTVVAISDLEEETLHRIIEKNLSGFSPESFQVSDSLQTSRPSGEREINIPRDTRQSFISLAFPLPGASVRGYALAYLAENLLGKGVGSRLWDLRSKEKLAYNVNSRLTQMREAGLLEVYLETDPEKKTQAREALRNMLAELRNDGLTEEDLESAKINARSSFLRANETKETRTLTLASFEALGLGCEYISRFFTVLESIGLDDMNAFLNDVLNPENWVEVVIGPPLKEE